MSVIKIRDKNIIILFCCWTIYLGFFAIGLCNRIQDIVFFDISHIIQISRRYPFIGAHEGPTIKDKFTIIVLSYSKREKMLQSFLENLINDAPKHLHQILVYWTSKNESQVNQIIGRAYENMNNNPPKLIEIYYFLARNDSSVNCRFDIPFIETDVFFSMDDDIRMIGRDIDVGFEIWKKHPKQIVGFMARGINIIPKARNIMSDSSILSNEKNQNIKDKKGKYLKALNNMKIDSKIYQNYRYLYDCSAVPYRFILTGIAFISKKMIKKYNSLQNKKNRDLVIQLNNCEDILMNFVVSNVTKLPPIYVKSSLTHIHSKEGISNQPNHYSIRDICVNKMVESFKGIPMPAVYDQIYQNV